jgi:phosphatidylglycerol:prolipoprotein diacylglycerol transferase
LNTTLGGDLRYVNAPMDILNLKQGGLHYFGALLFGALAFYLYARKMGLDFWLALDAVSPGLLIGQAVARPANLINQELYGQPTHLPWGIKIFAQNRIPPWNNMALYPEDVTRFHPTFAYEIIFNLLAAGLLVYITRKYKEKMKPGVAFGMWLVLAGLGRNVIEFFRPDQPTFPGTGFSYSRLVAILMMIGGILLILIKYRVLRIRFISAGPDSYTLAPPLEEQLEKAKQAQKIDETSQDVDEKDRDDPEEASESKSATPSDADSDGEGSEEV